MKTKLILSTMALLLLISVAFTLRSNKATVEKNVYRPEPDKKLLVHTSTAIKQDVAQEYSYTGTFAPYREVMLTAQIYGEVKGIFAEEGDFVRAGKTLVQIDDHILQAQYQAAEANYITAKRNLERYESAATSGGVSNLQLDNLKLNLATTESQLKQLKRQIDLSKIVAPFDGTITMRSVEIGSVAGQNPIARITDLQKLKLEVSVPEKEIVLFREGAKANVVTDVYPGTTLHGTIEYVSDRGDEAHNYDVRIVLDNNQSKAVLKAGMYGTAVLKSNTPHQTLFIPRAALLGSAKNPQVFVVNGDRVALKNILTGYMTADMLEVKEGLNEGDVVVTTGHINLADGSAITIAND
jgi:RND family efflux transporter MFP subunit